MRNTRILRRVLYLASLGILGTLVAVLFPVYTLLVAFGVIALLSLSRQLNFYKIVMMIKRCARDAAKLRFAIRTRVRLGFKDYHTTLDDEAKSRSKTGYIR